jgi:hypothetical protein
MRSANVAARILVVAALLPLVAGQCRDEDAKKRSDLGITLGQTSIDDVHKRIENLPDFETVEVGETWSTFRVEATYIDLSTGPGGGITDVQIFEQDPLKTTVCLGVRGLYIGDPKKKFERNLFSKGRDGMFKMMKTTDYPGDVDGTSMQVAWKEGDTAMFIHYFVSPTTGGEGPSD